MRFLHLLICFAALLDCGAVFAFEGPCNLASDAEAARILRGAVMAVPADEIGEETAPMCLWATPGRVAAIKLSVWSVDELPVLGLRDAESYFVRRERESRTDAGYAPVDGFGLRAFQHGFTAGEGTVVVLKDGRVAEFEFAGVDPKDARAFVRLVMERF